MSLPQSMKAYKCQAQNQAALVDTPLPALRPDYLLVKVEAVALNPTDWKHLAGIPTPGATAGCDFSGTVVQIGNQVNKSFKPGDRVAAFTHGVNAVQPEDGCFAEYAVCKGDITFKLPEYMSFEEGATLGVGVVTVGQGMYQALRLPTPNIPASGKSAVLVYGGSTATGLFALQYAKLSGLQVITTCSPKNDALVKAHGADAVFDYNSPTCGADIRAFTNDKLGRVFDCISEGSSPAICAAALASKGENVDVAAYGSDVKLQYSSLLPVEFPRQGVQNGFTLGYTVAGERFTFRGGMEFPAKREDFEFGKGWVSLAEDLLNEKRIKAVPTDQRSGGLEKVEQGLTDLREGRVSGSKIVYKV